MFMTGPPHRPLSKEAFYAKLASTPAAQLPRVSQMFDVRYEDGMVDWNGAPLEVGPQVFVSKTSWFNTEAEAVSTLVAIRSIFCQTETHRGSDLVLGGNRATEASCA
jgi:hypothetical protein